MARPRSKRLPLWKLCIFAAVTAYVGIASIDLTAQLFTAFVFHQDEALDLTKLIKQRVVAAKVDTFFTQYPKPFVYGLLEKLYAPEGEEVLAELTSDYEEHFDQLVAEVADRGATMVVVYIPTIQDKPHCQPARAYTRQLFAKLCAEHELPYVDTTDVVLSYQDDEIMGLEPYDGHPSPLVYRLVARQLTPVVKPLLAYRAKPLDPPRVSQIVGDYFPSNSGLKGRDSLPFKKAKVRCLCLGDSYCEGAFLPHHCTFPFYLEAYLGEETEVLNGGRGGYTIVDQLALYQDRGYLCEADVVVLQVLDNDVWGMLAFVQNALGRELPQPGRSWDIAADKIPKTLPPVEPSPKQAALIARARREYERRKNSDRLASK